eukprot:CAMPEP_0201908458 /NCGR_PEP_ID=MMETSP0903-20130614/568_1 /ASSEMBLY_ACC=CAM_ASM_000552 /TAXON_ID=420261 /ORGANISM="Thalassiosira antarctica, Strain CCMP982" /LENGTH=35 /DNA_ID= /DNA_START= /DNA_END= /DNA_ORIENTATION=
MDFDEVMVKVASTEGLKILPQRVSKFSRSHKPPYT